MDQIAHTQSFGYSRDELLNREIFYSIREAQVIIELLPNVWTVSGVV